ncbi:Hpt domain-containing protein [uncultured Umboniibacter sp.]|uniref:Hpt domain-containing protein n=1 Tax=uncultured Umboniibacter sp. TaxID=1798917 RepID=UPI00262B69B0|nr:Hpt domain-containing protein [uncultured Umboniibacter sp.]
MESALVIDTPRFKDICCQQADIATSLLSQIQNDLPELASALDSKDTDEILFAAHRFLGIGRYCGIDQLVAVSQEIESEGLRGIFSVHKIEELKELSCQLSQWLGESKEWVAQNFS